MTTPLSRSPEPWRGAPQPPVGPEPKNRIARYEQVRSLVHACHARLGRPLPDNDLEDAVQSTAIAAWRRRHSYSARSSIETWIYGIARLELLDAMRRRQRSASRLVALEQAADVTGPVASRSTLGDGTRLRVLKLLSEMGTTAALILRLRLMEDEGFDRIGERVHLSESAAKARFHRLLPRARARLGGIWRSIAGAEEG